MKLQEKLDAMKKESAANRPPEMVATLVQEIQGLVKSGIADKFGVTFTLTRKLREL
jgi:hypothetical protein